MAKKIKPEIQQALLSSATDPSLQDVIKDYTELGLESVVDSELVEAIPVIKTFVAIFKGVGTIQDRIFIKKLALFLNAANHISSDEKNKWYEKHISSNKKREEELGDKLLILIDAVNDNYKAEILGKIFRCFVKGEIDTYEEFIYLCEMVENCYTNILRGLANGASYSDEMLFRLGFAHSNNPTGEDISKMLANEAQSASRGMTAVTRLPYRSAEYTSAGLKLIHILRTQ